jgi:hypothetical protein
MHCAGSSAAARHKDVRLAPKVVGRRYLACFQEVGELVAAALQNLHVKVCSDSAVAKAVCKLVCSERK